MCDHCDCNKVFSTEQAEELVREHGLKACLIMFYYAARSVAKDGDHPGYHLVSEKMIRLIDLLRR
jgi:hypothetical protein